MISLSRIIKSAWAKSDLVEQKKIEIKTVKMNTDFEITEEIVQPSFDQEEIDLIYKNAQEEAQAIIQKAIREAEAIRKQAEAEKENWFQIERVSLEEDARQIGYSEGHDMGMQQGYAEMHEQILQAQKVIELAKDDYHRYLDASEKTILELSVEIANKILNAEVEEKQELFINLVRKAIKEVKEHNNIRLIIHYSKYELILSHKEELMSIMPKETDFHIYPDEELDETSCVIESSNGRIDASIDSQIQEIKRKLLELLEGE